MLIQEPDTQKSQLAKMMRYTQKKITALPRAAICFAILKELNLDFSFLL